jgi:hypothetical protein
MPEADIMFPAFAYLVMKIYYEKVMKLNENNVDKFT